MKWILRLLIFNLFVFVGPLQAQAKVKSKTVTYKSHSKKHKGFMAWNAKQKAKRPGVLILPEWWGINKDMKSKALKMAQLGYVVLVADLYGYGKTASTPQGAGQLLSTIQGKNGKKANKAYMSALFLLKRHPLVKDSRIAVVGYGLGGGLATDMLRRSIDVKAVVNFFGAVNGKTKAKSGFVKAPLLWLKGEHDAFIDLKMEENLKKEMKQANAKLTVKTYPKTFHSFTFPQADRIGKKHNFFISYNANSDKQSWLEMKNFLKRNL